MRNYDLILFDLDNTILDFSKIEAYSLKKTLKNYGITVEEAVVEEYRKINKEEWDKFQDKKQTKKETTINRFCRLSKFIGKEFPVEKVNEEYLEHLTEEVYFIKEAEDTLEKIKTTGIRMGMLSNGVKKVQEKRFEKAGLGRFFEHVLTSEEAGVPKPDPKIFGMILDKFEIKPEKTLFVGDSYESDIVGALNSGMKPIWYKPDFDIDDTEIKDGNYEIITRLSEIIDFL